MSFFAGFFCQEGSAEENSKTTKCIKPFPEVQSIELSTFVEQYRLIPFFLFKQIHTHSMSFLPTVLREQDDERVVPIHAVQVAHQQCLRTKGEGLLFLAIRDMGVSKNRGTPKGMVYNGKPY